MGARARTGPRLRGDAWTTHTGWGPTDMDFKDQSSSLTVDITMFLLWESLSCFLERVLNFDHVTVLKDPKVPESWNLDSWVHLPNISLQEKSTIHRDLRSDRKNILSAFENTEPKSSSLQSHFPIKIAGCFYRPCKSRHLAGHIHQISWVNSYINTVPNSGNPEWYRSYIYYVST